jgi:hypothetical protein
MNQESRKAGKQGNKDDFLLNPLRGPEGSCFPNSNPLIGGVSHG